MCVKSFKEMMHRVNVMVTNGVRHNVFICWVFFIQLRGYQPIPSYHKNKSNKVSVIKLEQLYKGNLILSIEFCYSQNRTLDLVVIHFVTV